MVRYHINIDSLKRFIMKRGTLTEVHISDIHFGAFDPKVQYNILKEQFLDKINQLPRIDLISI